MRVFCLIILGIVSFNLYSQKENSKICNVNFKSKSFKNLRGFFSDDYDSGVNNICDYIYLFGNL